MVAFPDTDTGTHTIRPNTHDHHTHTCSLTPTHIRSLSLTHTHLHPHPPSHPCPEGSSLAQMIRSRLLTARVAAGRWWTDQQPDCSQIAARLRLDRARG